MLRTDQQFPRGDGPLVSVLLPTRGRTHGLHRSVESLLRQCLDRSLVEILLKVDDDDAETLEFVKGMGWAEPIRVYSGPRGEGYWHIHEWLTFLGTQARGDWLLNWSDDCEMLTQGWERHLLMKQLDGTPLGGFADGVFLYLLRNPQRPGNHEYFAIRREAFHAMGGFGQSPHVDTWLASVFKIIERCEYTEIYIKHDNDRADDQTAKDRRDVTQFSAAYLISSLQSRQRLADAERLLNYIDNFHE